MGEDEAQEAQRVRLMRSRAPATTSGVDKNARGLMRNKAKLNAMLAVSAVGDIEAGPSTTTKTGKGRGDNMVNMAKAEMAKAETTTKTGKGKGDNMANMAKAEMAKAEMAKAKAKAEMAKTKTAKAEMAKTEMAMAK